MKNVDVWELGNTVRARDDKYPDNVPVVLAKGGALFMPSDVKDTANYVELMAQKYAYSEEFKKAVICKLLGISEDEFRDFAIVEKPDHTGRTIRILVRE